MSSANQPADKLGPATGCLWVNGAVMLSELDGSVHGIGVVRNRSGDFSFINQVPHVGAVLDDGKGATHVAELAELVTSWTGGFGHSRDPVGWKDGIDLLFEKRTDCVQIADGRPEVPSVDEMLVSVL
jgi:hypothetical protein